MIEIILFFYLATKFLKINKNVHIEDLPDEILLDIFSHLGSLDLSRVSQVNYRLHCISETEVLWRELTLKHNPNLQNLQPTNQYLTTSWKKEFVMRKLYEREREDATLRNVRKWIRKVKVLHNDYHLYASISMAIGSLIITVLKLDGHLARLSWMIPAVMNIISTIEFLLLLITAEMTIHKGASLYLQGQFVQQIYPVVQLKLQNRLSSFFKIFLPMICHTIFLLTQSWNEIFDDHSYLSLSLFILPISIWMYCIFQSLSSFIYTFISLYVIHYGESLIYVISLLILVKISTWMVGFWKFLNDSQKVDLLEYMLLHRHPPQVPWSYFIIWDLLWTPIHMISVLILFQWDNDDIFKKSINFKFVLSILIFYHFIVNHYVSKLSSYMDCELFRRNQRIY